jgi:type VI secretion system protein ImpC
VLGDILDASSPVNVEETMAEVGGDLHGFIQRVLKPHLVPNPDPRQAELVSQVEAAASATLRAILHSPGYQSLESLWRAVDLLVRQVETSADLKILLIDLSQAELASALPAGGDPAASPLARLLAGHADPEPWSLLVGAYEFGDSPEDVDRLAQLAALGAALRAPWVSAAQPELAGMGPDVGEISTWPQPHQGLETLRSVGFSRSLGLVLPRFLARLPYGKGLEESERFRFEELTPEAPADQFLWGNPAVMVAVVLGRAFAEHGWALMRGLEPEVSGLPVGTLGRGPTARVVGPGEAPLSVRASDVLMSRGFMVLAPLKESDRVRLVRVQAAASPLAGLAGRWA